jgi:hypothetical protein
MDDCSETSRTLSRSMGKLRMPFRGMPMMDQKREFVVFAATEGANVRELCRRFGIEAHNPSIGRGELEKRGRRSSDSAAAAAGRHRALRGVGVI